MRVSNVVIIKIFLSYVFITFIENLHQNEEIIQLKKIIKRQIEIAIDDCVEYLAKFKNYDYIWLEDKDVYLKQFIEEWPKSNLHEEEEDIQCESDLKLESFQNQVCINEV